MKNDTLSNILLLLFMSLVLKTLGQNNPCAGLPLCKLKKSVANKLGVPAATFTTTKRPFRRPPVRSNSKVENTDDEDDQPGSVRIPFRSTGGTSSDGGAGSSSTSNSGSKSALRSALEKRKNSACAGLILCRLKPKTNVPGRATATHTQRITTTTLPPIPIADPFQETLLSAVLNGHLDTAKQLIEEGADVNAEDVYGNSVLHIAAQNGRTEIIDPLLLGGANVNKGNNHKNTALHLAAQNGWTKIAEKLLRHKKININGADLGGSTALHLAAQNGQIGVTKLLVDAGAELNQDNAHGHVPLHLSAQNGHYDLTQLLVLSGADLDYKDAIGNTPLHTAYHTSHREIAQMLENSGANANARNKSGQRPFQLG